MFAAHDTLARLIVLTLIAGLIGGPFARALADRCDRCPTDCPMHQQAKLGCHAGGKLTVKAPGTHCGSTPGYTRPGCGKGHDLPDLARFQGVLPRNQVSWQAPPSLPFDPFRRRLLTRQPEPPEPPPPIRSV